MAFLISSKPPSGFHFAPTDNELLNYFLKSKVNGDALPCLYPKMPNIDVYVYHPSAIFEYSESDGVHGSVGDDDGEKEMHCYVFTNLKSKESNDNNACKKNKGKRKCRTVGNLGTWEQQFTKNLSNFKGSLLGFKKYFKFVPSNVDDNKDGKQEYEWSMYEYTLLDHPDFALCRLTKKKMNKKNNNGSGIVIQLAHVYGDDGDGDNRKRARVDNDELCWDNDSSALIGSPCLTNVDVDDFFSRMDEFINDVDKGVYDQLFSEPSKQDYHNNDDLLRLVIVDDDDDVDKGIYDKLLSQLGQVQGCNNHHLRVVDDNDDHLQISSSLPDQCFSVDDSTTADQDWDDGELQDLLNQD